MKILHTSDWHIGKQLLKFDLTADLDLFFEWLINYIKSDESGKDHPLRINGWE